MSALIHNRDSSSFAFPLSVAVQECSGSSIPLLRPQLTLQQRLVRRYKVVSRCGVSCAGTIAKSSIIRLSRVSLHFHAVSPRGSLPQPFPIFFAHSFHPSQRQTPDPRLHPLLHLRHSRAFFYFHQPRLSSHHLALGAHLIPALPPSTPRSVPPLVLSFGFLLSAVFKCCPPDRILHHLFFSSPPQS